MTSSLSASSLDEEALVAKRREIRAQQPAAVAFSSAASPTRSNLLVDSMRRSEDEFSVVERVDPLLPVLCEDELSVVETVDPLLPEELPMLCKMPLLLSEVECSNVGSLNPV